MYKITEKVALNPTVTKMVIEAPLIAKKAKPGQFIIVRPFEDSERIPLTVAGYDREAGTVEIIFQIVGGTTMELNSLNVGDSVHDFVGPLGRATEVEGLKKGCVVGGGVGCAMAFLVIYVISSVALNSSMVFYDALLVDATTDDRMDEISSQGYAWGYIGSCVPFIACLLVVLNYDALGIGLQTAMQIAFVITAAWWLAFTIPMLRDVQQKHFKPREEHAVSRAIKGIGGTLKEMWGNKAIKFYMIAYFFYIDGVHTIIKLSTSYGTDLGISSTQLVLALLVTQFVAFPSAIIYGRLSSKYGTRRMLLIAIAAYFGITLFAALFLRTATEFWILAILVGMFQGGIQALSRSEFGKLCPKKRANEYFGFFDIFGKYAAILGTFLVGTFTALTGNSSLGVMSIAVLFVIGFVMMLKVPAREEAAE